MTSEPVAVLYDVLCNGTVCATRLTKQEADNLIKNHERSASNNSLLRGAWSKQKHVEPLPFSLECDYDDD